MMKAINASILREEVWINRGGVGYTTQLVVTRGTESTIIRPINRGDESEGVEWRR